MEVGMQKRCTNLGRDCPVCQKHFFPFGSSQKYCSRKCWSEGSTKPLAERFFSHVEKTDGCWLWTGSTDVFGYGKMTMRKPNKRPVATHRISWEIHFGAIPAGLLVCHKCDNPPCVNPDHLFLGTHADNNADMMRKGRQVITPMPGEKNQSAKLTEDQAREAIELRKQGQTLKQIGDRFHVSFSCIHLLVTGKKWAHLTQKAADLLDQKA